MLDLAMNLIKGSFIGQAPSLFTRLALAPNRSAFACGSTMARPSRSCVYLDGNEEWDT